MKKLSQVSFREGVVELCRRDRDLERVVEEFGMPEFWCREPGFRTLVLFILEQQVSLASAQATFLKLEEGLVELLPTTLSAISDEQFRSFGVSRQKARYIRELSTSVHAGVIDLDALAQVADEQVAEQLLALPGIGPWTSQVYLLSALGRPDAWPVGDRALQVATGDVLRLDAPPDSDQLTEIGTRWQPLRAVAARILWHHYLCTRRRTNGPI